MIKRNLRIKDGFALALWLCLPTACVTRVWAGVDKVWEQKKLEARKMLVNRADSHTSGARFVGHFTERKTRCPKKDTTAFIHYFPALTKTVF
jgi:hypothetical protein